MTAFPAFPLAGEVQQWRAADIGVLDAGSPLLREPMVITDATRLMTEVWRWTPAFLRDSIGTTCLRATLPGADGKFRYEPGRVLDSHLLPVAQIFDDMASADGPRWCVQQLSVVRDLPALAGVLDLPSCIPGGLINAINLWLAAPGTVTPLHYDDTHNMFAQISGAKTFYLFPPESLDALYPGPLNTGAQHLSQVDLFHPDLMQYPLAAPLRYMKATVQAGQALVLPAFWWHQVASHGEVSTSVNFWWRAHVMDCLCPGLMRQLRSTAAQRDLAALTGTFELGGIADAIEFARLLSDIGEDRAAAGLCMSILHTVQPNSTQHAGQTAQLLDHLTTITSGRTDAW